MMETEKQRVAAEIRSRTGESADEETVTAVLERYDERTAQVTASAYDLIHPEFGVER